MDTLSVHKRRLQEQIDEAERRMLQIQRSACPDLRALKQLQDSIERNQQVMCMIDDHVGSDHMPTWRRKSNQ